MGQHSAKEIPKNSLILGVRLGQDRSGPGGLWDGGNAAPGQFFAG